MGRGIGLCSCVCKSLLFFWTVILMLSSLALIIYLSLKLNSFSRQPEDPIYLTDLLRELPGSGWYSDINMVTLDKYTWFALLGLSTIMFVASLIHIISTCKASKCLLGLGTFLLILVLIADIAGLVFRLEAQNSIDDRLNISLNNTIINMYGDPSFEKVTQDWNTINKEGYCCGILSGSDYRHAQHWSGNVTAGQAPCLSSVTDIGCREKISSKYILQNRLLMIILVSAKATLVVITLFATFCACCYSFDKSDDDDEVEAYDLMEDPHQRRRRNK